METAAPGSKSRFKMPGKNERVTVCCRFSPSSAQSADVPVEKQFTQRASSLWCLTTKHLLPLPSPLRKPWKGFVSHFEDIYCLRN